ncbi:alkaline phosphatase family protein [Fodinibius sediminis]|uniref:Predicted pyrophosphatase or phosphodiesterase, AlkP superfamily n=1 Tax=Fodinibius sediminis TaxID=1214077 RepID=A0A521DMP7_9BACT|nr:nucleotide pyrophosphatase/phosphodiesterase family protein [Fodinibius sediminis]SMO72875.1 Predicted pyrophosphatase or phosphodiesterase, AlkP superfamily [Fodinibius sediminis]
MNKTAVLNVVGLTPDLIGEHTPFLKQWFEKGKSVTVRSMLPAVTCSVQATYLTGTMPGEHGIVGNGWYFRDTSEVRFWMRSGKLIQQPAVWDLARQRNPDFTCANLFWRYATYSGADYVAIERPMYRKDGVKVPDVYARPMTMRDKLQDRLGPFPLFNFWGPNTTIASSKWIAEAAKMVAGEYDPTLSLVYLPHLDYCLQRIGPDLSKIKKDLREIDQVCEDLITYYEERDTQVMVLSEYGIASVNQPVSLNRVLREEGFITVREELGGEVLDAGASRAFAVADHQVAHIYIEDPTDIEPVKRMLEEVPGVETILGKKEKNKYHLDHQRSGELIAVAEPEAWFTYYYWLDDAKAPDFAPTVDIHAKPGYDPAEMLLDPGIPFPKLKAGLRLLQKKLGFRYIMDLIPTNGEGVKGSHGRISSKPETSPLLASRQQEHIPEYYLQPTDIQQVILRHLFGDEPA